MSDTIFASAFKDREGFPRPDWDFMRNWIEKNVRQEKWHEAFDAAAETWLNRLRQHLGKPYEIDAEGEFGMLNALKHEEALASLTARPKYPPKRAAHPFAWQTLHFLLHWFKVTTGDGSVYSTYLQSSRCIRAQFTVHCAATILLPMLATPAFAADYHVGDGQPFSSIGAVSWHTLQPGDTVWIHWRATPYREKWVIGRQGTQQAPITVRGVPGPNGQLPLIEGENATTPAPLSFTNENRSVIKIGSSNVPANDVAQWIVIQSLDIRGARPPSTFTDDNGNTVTYSQNAAAIHVSIGEHITIRGCTLRDCGNGLFVTSFGPDISRDIIIENNYIHSNGNSASLFEHNTYTAAIGILYQYNRFGPLVAGAGGNNLKDRSAGLVVRYNWIEGGNRQLDLVDAEDSTIIRDDPAYHRTDVYGNVLIEPAGAGNKQVLHYGGDSGTIGDYRKGFLYFYHNTVISTRTDSTTLMRLSTDEERCDARNNIIYVSAAGNSLALLDEDGVLDIRRNWLKPGWRSFGTPSGIINNDGTQIETAAPGFVNEAAQDYALLAASVCKDAALDLHPVVLPAGAVTRQYVKHQSSMARLISGTASDLGAFELQLAPCPGDLDCDGDRDANDVAAIVTILVEPAAYTGCDITRADMNGDGGRDACDIAPFVAALLSGPCT